MIRESIQEFLTAVWRSVSAIGEITYLPERNLRWHVTSRIVAFYVVAILMYVFIDPLIEPLVKAAFFEGRPDIAFALLDKILYIMLGGCVAIFILATGAIKRIPERLSEHVFMAFVFYTVVIHLSVRLFF